MNNVPTAVCVFLCGRNVDSTGKFCAGGCVDACQVVTLTIKQWLYDDFDSRRIRRSFDVQAEGQILAGGNN